MIDQLNQRLVIKDQVIQAKDQTIHAKDQLIQAKDGTIRLINDSIRAMRDRNMTVTTIAAKDNVIWQLQGEIDRLTALVGGRSYRLRLTRQAASDDFYHVAIPSSLFAK